MKSGQIRIGIGGWTFEPWRGVFYPKGLAHSKELAYASERLTSIEVNGTFYRSQTPATFRKWASEVPNGFVFSLKGPRFAVNRRVLAEAGDSIKRFLDSGVTELGEHLGPLLWQFSPFKKFDPADFGKFLEALPEKFDGHTLRHVIEVRHPSFLMPEFIAMLRQFKMAPVYTDHATYPNIADSPPISSMRGCSAARTTSRPPIRRSSSPNGRVACRPGRRARSRRTSTASTASTRRKPQPRDVFAYVIHEGKIRAPAAAMALIEKLKG